LQIGGIDKIDLYLMAWNTHDGTSSFQILVTPIRVVCQNTLTAAIQNAKSSYALRHTPQVTGKIQQARDALGITFKYAEAFEKEAESLLSQTMTDAEFNALVLDIIPIDEQSSRVTNLADVARDTLIGLWRAPTQANIAKTKWAAYNAFVEYADWAKPVRGDNEQTARALRIVTGAGDTFKNKALALLK
jgi:phage/plasmid-like protein (TIGR03299 family)